MRHAAYGARMLPRIACSSTRRRRRARRGVITPARNSEGTCTAKTPEEGRVKPTLRSAGPVRKPVSTVSESSTELPVTVVDSRP